MRQMKGKHMKKLIAFIAVLFTFFSVPVFADTIAGQIPDKPPESGIYDPNHYLDGDIHQLVSELNIEYSKTKLKPQIAIVMLKELDSYYDIEDVARQTARSWKIGYSDTNYGLLVLVDVTHHKIRTETSNEMSTIITDSDSSDLNDSVKDYFRDEDYPGGINEYLTQLNQKLSPYINLSQKEIKAKQEKEQEEARKKAGILLLFGAVGAAVMGMAFVSYNWFDKRDRKKRSQYDYDGDDKLYPYNMLFIDNDSWTSSRVNAAYDAYYLKRSQYDYSGSNKLYPGMSNFVNVWTAAQLTNYYLERSNRKYTGSDKLYPDDDNFVKNDSWSDSDLLEYRDNPSLYEDNDTYSYSNSSSSSYSSSSSDSWSGGGFDGGGATGGW